MTAELELRTLPMGAIRLDPRNPRTEIDDQSLEELAASIRSGGVVQPPTVTPAGDGYRVLLGERRVRAARLAGLEAIPCLVRPVSGETEAHRLRLMENLHRQPLNPIDRAAALRLAWLLANARALGAADEAEALLAEPRPPVAVLPEMEALLTTHGFKSTAPPVTWDQVLDELGIEMSPDRRKKLLRVLAIPQDVQQTLRQVDISEAAVRSIGSLAEEDQREIAAAIQEDPSLARKARRIANAVRNEGYSVQEALDEARGQFADDPEAADEDEESFVFEGDSAVVEAVLAFIDAVNQLLSALTLLRNAAPEGDLDIPDPWLGYYRDARSMLMDELETM